MPKNADAATWPFVYDAASLENYMRQAIDVSPERPVLIDRYLEGAEEFDVDAVADGDTRSFMPRFTQEHFDANKALVDKLGEIAAAKGCTIAQLAIAWVLAQGDTIVPIPGTRKIERLDENIGALDVTLSPEDLAAIEAANPVDAVSGTRYPEAAMGTVNL